MAEFAPELISQIEKYLQERERGEIKLLSFFYKQLFGRELKTGCASCIEDAILHIKKVIKIKIHMTNYKWVGGNASVNIRIGDKIVNVNKNNCTDVYAEKISSIAKYSHLVECIELKEPKLKKIEEDFEKVGELELEVTILTSQEVKKEEEVVKKKRGRPKLK